jgi:hypothetical protein
VLGHMIKSCISKKSKAAGDPTQSPPHFILDEHRKYTVEGI